VRIKKNLRNFLHTISWGTKLQSFLCVLNLMRGMQFRNTDYARNLVAAKDVIRVMDSSNLFEIGSEDM
jgi:hypothetical protein